MGDRKGSGKKGGRGGKDSGKSGQKEMDGADFDWESWTGQKQTGKLAQKDGEWDAKKDSGSKSAAKDAGSKEDIDWENVDWKNFDWSSVDWSQWKLAEMGPGWKLAENSKDSWTKEDWAGKWKL